MTTYISSDINRDIHNLCSLCDCRYPLIELVFAYDRTRIKPNNKIYLCRKCFKQVGIAYRSTILVFDRISEIHLY